ncbi:MAG: sugar phosphate isomerase/epimerase family protein [Planctomycetaceae bacterium]
MFRNLSTVGLPLSGRPSELIELALSFGFDAMDIDIIDFQQQAEAFGVEHARRLMVSARLKCGVFHLPISLIGDEAAFKADLAALEPRLEFAKATEATRAVVTVAPASDEHDFKDFFELYRKRLDAVGAAVEKHGIVLGLALAPEVEARAGKAHPFIHTYEGLIGLVSASHPSTGVVIDSWALHLGGEPLSVIGEVPKGRIVEVRLSDAPRDVAPAELGHGQRLMPGETRVIAAPQILAAARDAGFEGPVTPWADRSTLTGRGREKIVRLAGDRVDGIWKEAGLPIVPRWFAPTARENAPRFGEDPALAGAGEGRGPAPA